MCALLTFIRRLGRTRKAMVLGQAARGDGIPLSKTGASEAQLLLALVATIQGLHNSGELDVGEVISLDARVLPSIWCSQTSKTVNALCSKLRSSVIFAIDNGTSRYNVRRVLKDSFSSI